ncbi:transcription factor TFIIB cyclin-related protein [Halorubrum distributum JCM 10247]|uniref:Transcription factor TFIIB cyclin-related protein n=1 Tax=Halorubrum distributum JCM 10247 TaxID=1227486 RepID=M0DK98_9EURY|nr:transcription factor TFIIB cyclin-related protein [Halorubrum terrestre JCM 10247]
MMHDKGLSTNIGWQDKDAYGKSLSGRQRRRMQRLRTWNERFRTRDSKERNLKQALGEIDRMASALGLPDNVRETASVIYRRALARSTAWPAPSASRTTSARPPPSSTAAR